MVRASTASFSARSRMEARCILRGRTVKIEVRSSEMQLLPRTHGDTATFPGAAVAVAAVATAAAAVAVAALAAAAC